MACAEGQPLVLVLLLVGLMLVPMVAGTTVEVTRDVAGSFIGNIGLSLVVTVLMFALFPSLASEPEPAPKPILSAEEVNRRAWILTAITGSYAVVYFSFGWTNVHTPIYIAIYAYSANLARGLTVSKGILAANVAAGLTTLVMYELTVMTPHLPFVAGAGADGRFDSRPDDYLQRIVGAAGRVCIERGDDPVRRIDHSLQR